MKNKLRIAGIIAGAAVMSAAATVSAWAVNGI